LDNKIKPTHKYDYKRKLTPEEIAAGRLAKVEYYIFDKTTGEYVLYEDEFKENTDYYKLEWTEARNYWTINMINKRKMTAAEIGNGK
jgi:uncharacterized phage-like protein YoqJ